MKIMRRLWRASGMLKMANKYCPIVGTLGFVLSADKAQVLMVHRNAREHDDQLGKYNGLGGHMEADEDVVE